MQSTDTIECTIAELLAFAQDLKPLHRPDSGPVDVGDAYTTGVIPGQPTLF